jgi:hypothetical protein
MFLSTALARPAWAAYDKEVFEGDEMPEVMVGKTDAPLGFFQYDQGHVMWAAFPAFFDHAEGTWER